MFAVAVGKVALRMSSHQFGIYIRVRLELSIQLNRASCWDVRDIIGLTCIIVCHRSVDLPSHPHPAFTNVTSFRSHTRALIFCKTEKCELIAFTVYVFVFVWVWHLVCKARVIGDVFFGVRSNFNKLQNPILQYSRCSLDLWHLLAHTGALTLKPSQGTKLYCLVNRSTLVWTTCPRSLPDNAAAETPTSRSRVRLANHYTAKSLSILN